MSERGSGRGAAGASVEAPAAHAAGGGNHGNGKRLGPFLCWAAVFADIGTSAYYVPGILYGQVGHLAGLFVAMTLVVFLLLTLKYAEATHRFPEGGGEVTVATRGLSPWAGALGGMFILIDYFLTAAISSLSGLHYFAVVAPSVAPYALLITVLVVIGLGALNWWGIQESAMVSAVIATAAFASDLVIILVVLVRVPLADIVLVFRDVFSGGKLTGLIVLTGYAGAFLAFSGLESIAQLAPVMRLPRRKTVAAALGVVALTVGLTSPLLTTFSTVLLTDPRFRDTMRAPGYATNVEPTQFISLLGGAYGGAILAVATAVTASALLIFASNTAIIGGYHVVLAPARLRYFPRLVTRMSALRGTPNVAIGVVTVIPIVALLAVRGNIDLLGELYGFGLLGAFALMCISMDVIRWRERRGEPYIGARVDPELARAAGPAARGRRDSGGPAGFGTRAVRAGGAGWEWARGGRPSRARRPRAGRSAPARVCRPALAHVRRPVAADQVRPGLLDDGAGARRVAHQPIGQAAGDALRRRADGARAGRRGAALSLSGRALHGGLPRHPTAPGRRLAGGAHPGPGREQGGDKRCAAGREGAPADLPVPRPALATAAAHLRDPRPLRAGRGRAADALARQAGVHGRGDRGPLSVCRRGAQQLFGIGARVRPDEMVAEAGIARRLAHAAPTESGMAISPDYIRFREVDGVPVAHYVLHRLYSAGV